MKVQKAVARLSEVLPIKNRLDQLDSKSANVYLAVVNGFQQQGKALSIVELELVETEAADIVPRLAQMDMLTLDKQGEVKGCYPFIMEQRVHTIQINGHKVHAMCALDALAPSAMFECPSEVDSECAVSGEPVHIELDNQQVLNEAAVVDVHFGINWMAASSSCSCSETLCTEMLFLKDEDTAQSWLNEDADNREIFNLTDAMAFSTGFFKPMMQQG